MHSHICRICGAVWDCNDVDCNIGLNSVMSESDCEDCILAMELYNEVRLNIRSEKQG